MIYIPNDDTQNYPLFRFELMNQLIKNQEKLPKNKKRLFLNIEDLCHSDQMSSPSLILNPFASIFLLSG